MRRREFITLLGGATVWPLAARAQQPRTPVIGFLHSASPAPYASLVAAFRQGLSETGFIEGRNVTIQYRWAEGQYDRLPALAAELVALKVEVIMAAGGEPSPLAAKAATTTIPIVFTSGGDPVEAGLVASLNRPGGNLTGIYFMNTQLVGKQLGLLHGLLPAAGRFAVLVQSSNPRTVAYVTADAQAAASTIGRQIDVFSVGSNDEIDAAFASIVQKRTDGLLIGTGPLFNTRRAQLATLTARHALPAIHSDRQFVEATGLMSYGARIS